MLKRGSFRIRRVLLFLLVLGAAALGAPEAVPRGRATVIDVPRVFSDDVKRAAAEKLMAEGEALRKQNSGETYKQATEKYLEALKLWKELADEPKQAAALTALFEIASATGQLKSSLAFADQALALYRKLGDRPMEAETLNNLAAAHDGLGDTHAAITYIQESVNILEGVGDRKRQGVALNGLGMFYSNIGKIQPAFDALNRSLALRRETGDRAGEARTLINIGTVLDETGEKLQAAEHYENGLRIAREVQDTRTESAALNNLGYVWHHLGEFQKSLDAYGEALELRRRTGNKQGEATTINNIGTVYRTLGENEEALKLLLRALEIYQNGGFKRNEARTHSSLGAVYREIGERQKGREHYQRALEMQRAVSNREGQASVLKNIGAMHYSDGEPDKALAAFGESLRISVELGDRETEADTHAALGRVYDTLHDAEKAEASFRRAQHLQAEMGTKGDLAETLHYFARLQNRIGRREAAIENMRTALSLIEEMRSRLTSHQFRTSYFAAQQEFFDFYVSLLVAQHRTEPGKGHDALALSASEQLRARSLLDSLGEARGGLRTGVPPELLARERIVRQTINALENQRLAAIRQNNSAGAGRYENEIAQLFRQQRDVQAEIRSSSPRFAALTQSAAPSLANIQSNLLDRDTVLLEYFLGKEKSYLFVVTDRSLEVVDLPSAADIEIVARSVVTDLRERSAENPRENPVEREKRIRISDGSWQKNNHRLSEILLKPVAARLRGKRLVIVSSGILQYVSFASLHDPREARRYLIEANELVHLPSVSILPLLRDARAGRRATIANTAAVLADPVFSADDSRVKKFAALGGNVGSPATAASRIRAPGLRSSFARLRFSRQEADAISSLLPDHTKFVATDFSANREAADMEALKRARVVHFATHGIVHSEFPELSSLVLSLVDENGKSRDGFLRLQDIYNMKLGADLVVLSACETALGKDIKGEGIIGLTRGFMHAGAPVVIATLWKVDDRATATLMKDFYRKLLKEGQTPASALRAAQIARIRSGTHSNPFYWAAFAVQGDWK